MLQNFFPFYFNKHYLATKETNRRSRESIKEKIKVMNEYIEQKQIIFYTQFSSYRKNESSNNKIEIF